MASVCVFNPTCVGHQNITFYILYHRSNLHSHDVQLATSMNICRLYLCYQLLMQITTTLQVIIATLMSLLKKKNNIKPCNYFKLNVVVALTTRPN